MYLEYSGYNTFLIVISLLVMYPIPPFQSYQDSMLTSTKTFNSFNS
jgi:hypothetical protein